MSDEYEKKRLPQRWALRKRRVFNESSEDASISSSMLSLFEAAPQIHTSPLPIQMTLYISTSVLLTADVKCSTGTVWSIVINIHVNSIRIRRHVHIRTFFPSLAVLL